jgi:hypothetical protein
MFTKLTKSTRKTTLFVSVIFVDLVIIMTGRRRRFLVELHRYEL